MFKHAHCRGLLLVVLLLSAPLPTIAKQVVTLAGDPWPPYVLGKVGEDASKGLAVELIRAIFARIPGVEVRFPLVPWKRALREVEQGNYDGIALLLRTPEREAYMTYSDPVIASRSLVWYRQKRFPAGFELTGLDDLLPFRVGVIRGYSYGKMVDAAIKGGRLKASEESSMRQLFMMLARDRVDLVLANDAVGYAMAKSYAEGEPIVPAKGATGEDVYRIGFSQRSKALELLPKVNRAIGELQAEGVFDARMKLFFESQVQ